jgi:hypothetical protein
MPPCSAVVSGEESNSNHPPVTIFSTSHAVQFLTICRSQAWGSEEIQQNTKSDCTAMAQEDILKCFQL